MARISSFSFIGYRELRYKANIEMLPASAFVLSNKAQHQTYDLQGRWTVAMTELAEVFSHLLGAKG